VRRQSITPYSEHNGRGELRYLQLTAIGTQPNEPAAQHDPQASVQVRSTIRSPCKLHLPLCRGLRVRRCKTQSVSSMCTAGGAGVERAGRRQQCDAAAAGGAGCTVVA
jgi:hypothetical protein